LQAFPPPAPVTFARSSVPFFLTKLTEDARSSNANSSVQASRGGQESACGILLFLSFLVYPEGMRNLRFFWQLFITFSVLILLSLGLLGWIVAARVEQNHLSQIEERLRGKAVLLESALVGALGDAEQLWKRLVAPTEDQATRITLIDDKGRVLADSARDA